ncbi:MAG: hypothetical protein KAS13_00020 [Candidatus Omnitrophica bacterium]|nr:hypothetical protein [Candidatus Omnitrophota bacterium]
MAIKCPKCERIYELLVFDAKGRVCCVCGENLVIEQEDVFERLQEICKQYELKLEEEEKTAQIRKMADSIVAMILNTECGFDEVELEKNKLKLMILEITPDKVHLYELIYEPRFRRLWKKIRESGFK